MTQEEKAKAYDEMTRLLSNWYKSETDIGIKDHISAIYPELKESEDERIRKDILVVLEKAATKFFKEEGKMPVWYDGAILWLEKQGKREYALKSFKDEDVHKFMQYFEKQAKAYEIELPNRSYDVFGLAKDILTWLEKQGAQKDIINNQSDYVDLGLPSGTLWSKFNLGAEKEIDFGNFYQWGDIQGHEGSAGYDFSWNTYKWGTQNNLTKYNSTDNNLVLNNEDDPVYSATDGKMKSPTKEQWEELIANTNHQWIYNFKESGVNGIKFTNKNDSTKYIFIPAAGYYYGYTHYAVNSWVYVWSSSRSSSDPNNAWCIGFDSGIVSASCNYRYLGFSVRGVLNNKNF